jgi:ribonuclease D
LSHSHPHFPHAPHIPTTIGREELALLPIRRYEGPVHRVESHHDLVRALHEIRRERVVGLDTETRPAFRKGESHRPSLAQIAASRAVYLFPLKRLDCAAALTEILENPEIVKTGVGLKDDFAKLRMRFPFVERRAVDLSAVAKRHGVTQPSARNLAGLFLGFRITKGQSTSNWGRAELTPQQIVYAATDAWVCRELYLCFEERGLLAPED